MVTTGRVRRVIGIVSMALTGLLITAGAATAAPQPSATEIKHKLDELNKQADQIVERYNQARTQLSAAQAKLKQINQQLGQDRRQFETQRARVAQLAAAAYRSGDLTSIPLLLSADDPQSVLDQATALTQVARNQAGQMTAFLTSAQQLAVVQQQAQAAADAAKKSADHWKARRDDVQKVIAQQRRLLAQLPPAQRPQPPASVGGVYTGPATGSARTAVQFAYAQIGKPYEWGAAGPGSYDCSGLTMAAWQAAGVSLPHSTYAQWNAGPHVDRSQLQPGDLVFFNSLGHVGIYVGNGQMIDAPHTGAYVRQEPIDGFGSYDGAVRP